MSLADTSKPQHVTFSFPCVPGQSGERPANPALWWVNGKGEEVKWSFQDLGSLSRKAANVLTKPCGLQRGDRVAVILPRIPEWWLINVACMRTGQYNKRHSCKTKRPKFEDFLIFQLCTAIPKDSRKRKVETESNHDVIIITTLRE